LALRIGSGQFKPRASSSLLNCIISIQVFNGNNDAPILHQKNLAWCIATNFALILARINHYTINNFHMAMKKLIFTLPNNNTHIIK